MPDRHLRILRDAARIAARRLRDDRAADAAPGAGTAKRDEELEQSAARAHERFSAAVRRRAKTGKS